MKTLTFSKARMKPEKGALCIRIQSITVAKTSC